MKLCRDKNRLKVSDKALTVFFAALGLCALVLAVLFSQWTLQHPVADISVDGQLYTSIDLSRVQKSYTVELPGNTVLVENGRIRMQSANCPDQLCVHQGAVVSGAYPIVCLPNRVVIQIREADLPGFDAVSGGGGV